MKQNLRHKQPMLTTNRYLSGPYHNPSRHPTIPAIVFEPMSSAGAIHGGSVILQQLESHPAFHDAFYKVQYRLLVGDGPLPLHYKHYIGIMACSEQHNEALFLEERDAFIATGGDRTWLEGVHRVPVKLRLLGEINKVMARAPWKLSHIHIRKLLTSHAHWSLAEITQALVVLVHFHSGVSFVLGTQNTLNDAIDPETSSTTAGTASDQSSTTSSGTEAESEAVVASCVQHPAPEAVGQTAKTTPTKMKQLKGILRLHQGSRSQRKAAFEASKALLSKEAEMFVRFKDLQDALDMVLDEDETRRGWAGLTTTAAAAAVPEVPVKDESAAASEDNNNSAAGLGCTCKRGNDGSEVLDFGRFLEVLDGSSVSEFKAANTPDNVLRDYSWAEDGYTALSLFYNDMVQDVDDKFKIAQTLTYNYIGSTAKQADTSAFRLAVWNFVQSLYGIVKDDYNYDDIGRLVSPELLEFVESACRQSHRILPAALEAAATGLDDSEKIHIRVLVMESKSQALMLYATRAIIHHRLMPMP